MIRYCHLRAYRYSVTEQPYIHVFEEVNVDTTNYYYYFYCIIVN